MAVEEIDNDRETVVAEMGIMPHHLQDARDKIHLGHLKDAELQLKEISRKLHD